MFAIFCYDVGDKRNAKVKKISRMFLRPVQKSVCEGFITKSKLNKLCAQIKEIINPEEDSVVIYKFDMNSDMEKLVIGQAIANENFIL